MLILPANQREAFEEWYKSVRKFETDIRGNNIGNVKSHTMLLARHTDDREEYLFGEPNVCWLAWRASTLAFNPLLTEKQQFENFYWNHLQERGGFSCLERVSLFKYNYGYVNSRVSICAKAWTEAYYRDDTRISLPKAMKSQ
jgi:hypothetical protein